MKKFEYYFLNVIGFSTEEGLAKFNMLGADGWELCLKRRSLYIFKRETVTTSAHESEYCHPVDSQKGKEILDAIHETLLKNPHPVVEEIKRQIGI